MLRGRRQLILGTVLSDEGNFKEFRMATVKGALMGDDYKVGRGYKKGSMWLLKI